MTLDIKGLDKSFGRQTVFKNFSIGFIKNSINCILGPSGCGKTTLLNIIAGIDNEYSGKIFEYSNLSYIFQEPRLLQWKTAADNISIDASDDNLTSKIIHKCQLEDVLDKYPFEMSGGMNQRVNIARAFASNTEILLMDEPFKSLDYILKKKLIGLFSDLIDEYPKTVVFVTHNIEEASLLAEELFVFSGSPVNINKHISLRNTDMSYTDKLSLIKNELN